MTDRRIGLTVLRVGSEVEGLASGDDRPRDNDRKGQLMTQDEPVSVARRLRAIASPVRLEILETLRLGGVLSTAELKRRVPDGRGGMQATLGTWPRRAGSVRRAAWVAPRPGVRWMSR